MTLLTNLTVADPAVFDDNSLSPDSFWNGADESGGFTSGDFWFSNNYNTTYKSWDGWAYSSMTDTTTPGWGNQYSAITGGGVNHSENYGVVYYSTWAATLPAVSLTDTTTGRTLAGAYLTNTTYAYLSMRDGDDMGGKKFGGESGDDPDWFCLTIKGIQHDGTYTVNDVNFYLADFRSENNSLDYIIDDWTWVDLTPLGDVIGMEFSMTSSDVGDYGINTPTYFAMDNLIPEPATLALFTLATGMALRRKRS